MTEGNGALRGVPAERVAENPARSFDYAQDDTAGVVAREKPLPFWGRNYLLLKYYRIITRR